VAALSSIADDLANFLGNAAPKLVTEEARSLTTEQVDSIAGGVLDLVFAKAEPGDSAAVLGEAVVVGALAAAHDFGTHDESVAVAVVERLEQMAYAARSALTEAAPSAEQKKLLDAVKSVKGKHVSAKQIAAEAGMDLKRAIIALNKLQGAGLVDYNLKTGYSVAQ